MVPLRSGPDSTLMTVKVPNNSRIALESMPINIRQAGHSFPILQTRFCRNESWRNEGLAERPGFALLVYGQGIL